MKKMKIYLFAALFMVSLTTMAANDGKDKKNSSAPVATATITGQVLDHESGEPLTGVLVKINGTDLKTYTDFDGHFSFEKIQPGSYMIVTKFISYQVHVDNEILVEKGDKKSMKVMMKKN